jgi:chromosome partitioning protein
MKCSKICFVNQKGGVGKTTSTITVADALARRGKRTLMVDFDPQGQCTVALNIKPDPGIFKMLISAAAPGDYVRETGRENLSIISGDRSTATAQIVLAAENRPFDAIRQALKPLENQFDYILFDTAPSVGGIQERAVWAANLIVIPVATDYLAVDSLGKTLEMLATLNKQGWQGKLAGILPTMYDHVTNESRKAYSYLEKNYPETLFTPIRRATILRDCTADGLTIWQKPAPGPVADDYRALVDLLMKLSRS